MSALGDADGLAGIQAHHVLWDSSQSLISAPFPHLDKGDGRCPGWVGTGDQPGAWHVALAVLSSLHLLVGADPD